MVWPEAAAPPTDMAKRLRAIADKRLTRVEAEVRLMGSNVHLKDALRSAYLQGLADGYDIAEKQIADLEKDNFALAAHQCVQGSGDESGNFRCCCQQLANPK